jgi:hypothetical protein
MTRLADNPLGTLVFHNAVSGSRGAGFRDNSRFAGEHGSKKAESVLFSNGAGAANCMAGALSDARGFGNLTPGEKTESPG